MSSWLRSCTILPVCRILPVLGGVLGTSLGLSWESICRRNTKDNIANQVVTLQSEKIDRKVHLRTLVVCAVGFKLPWCTKHIGDEQSIFLPRILRWQLLERVGKAKTENGLKMFFFFYHQGIVELCSIPWKVKCVWEQRKKSRPHCHLLSKILPLLKFSPATLDVWIHYW